MKQMCIWLAVAALSGAVCGGGEEKIAVVDSARVLKQYRKTQEADARMEEQMEAYNAEKDRMLEEHARLKKDFEKAREEARNKALSEKALNEKRDAAEEKLLQVVEYETRIRDMALTRRRQMEEERVRIHQRIVQEISEAISACAAREGYTLVLDASGMTSSGFKSVVYSATNMDITASVIGFLNETPAAPGK